MIYILIVIVISAMDSFSQNSQKSKSESVNSIENQTESMQSLSNPNTQ